MEQRGLPNAAGIEGIPKSIIQDEFGDCLKTPGVKRSRWFLVTLPNVFALSVLDMVFNANQFGWCATVLSQPSQYKHFLPSTHFGQLHSLLKSGYLCAQNPMMIAATCGVAMLVPEFMLTIPPT